MLGFANGAFTGFPKGYDAYGHMSKLKFLVDYFPNVDWNSEWYSGEFFSQGSFPPLFHYAGAALVGLFRLSLENALLVIAAASFVVIAGSLYGLVRVVTGIRAAPIIAVLLLLSSNAFWSYILLGGLYPRIVGMAFLALFAFCAVLYLKTRSRVAYVATVLALAGVLSSHLLLGAIGVALAILLIALLPMGVVQKVGVAAKLLVPTALLVAYFYVPYALSLSRPASVPLLTRGYSPVGPRTLLTGMESIPVVLLPLLILLGAAVWRSRAVISFAPLAGRIALAAGLAAAASLVYALVGLPVPHEFIYNFQPGQAVFFAAWFGAAWFGLAVPWASLPKWIPSVVMAALVTQLIVWPPPADETVVTGDNPAKRTLQSALQLDPNQRDHRVGVSWDAGSDWINARYDVPQTRGYQQQGVLYPDWQYWLETRLWSPDPNYGEKNFLLDWYAVKQFYGGPDPAVAQRFEAMPNRYASRGAGMFEALYADPILSARSTHVALVIGSDASYSLVVRSMALSDFDSQSLIPVRGGEYLDDHSADELAEFDIVILYGYKFRDPSRAMGLLDAFVKRGGGLIIEGGEAASSPVPGTEVKRKGIGPDWKLQPTTDPFAPRLAQDIDLGSFEPAAYNGGPWGVSYIPRASMAPWAGPVLTIDGDPVLVAGTLGSGRVAWSGMNLPYHIVSTRTAEESRLLTHAISWVAPVLRSPPAYDSTFVNPQLRRLTVVGTAAGVLFKESWVPNWTATVKGKPVPIYRAGPDLMYVPLRADLVYPAIVEFRFVRTWPELAGDTVSGITFLALLGWLVTRRLRRRENGASFAS